MDEELTDGYSEACAQCGAVCWALSDGDQFFCKQCHNLIEKTRDVDDFVDLQTSRITTALSKKQKGSARGQCAWLICEGFQIILKHQADALVALGVCPHFKTDVLWNFWKRFLQKTNQAFTKTPVTSARLLSEHAHVLTSDSEAESSIFSENMLVSDASANTDGSISDVTGNGMSKTRSGSLDAGYYLKTGNKHRIMTMCRTLSMCYLALLWTREAVTLSDLLRLVSTGHVPYINVHELFPEEMKLFGQDANIFRVESIPSHSKVQMEAEQLAKIMELPKFPTLTRGCLLHPAVLSMRYLIETNLPNTLHFSVRRLIRKTDMGKDCFLTFDPSEKDPKLPCYELQAAALIIITMKVLFKLDDYKEWELHKLRKSRAEINQGEKIKKGSKMFSLKKWYSILHPVLDNARNKQEQVEAMRAWKSKKPLITASCSRPVVFKKRRIVHQIQSCFNNLADAAIEPPSLSSSSFLFHWGKEKSADGPSLHGKSLDCLLRKKRNTCHLINCKYWHTSLRKCKKDCPNHYKEMEPTLPRMYVWVLGLFSFLLGIDEAQLHSEVVKVEHRLLMVKRTTRKTPKTTMKRRNKIQIPEK